MATIRDVAHKAGVSVATVSRVINNNARVIPETRERVLQAIKALNYRPSRTARQLSVGTTEATVGVMLPYMTFYSFVERLRGIQSELRKHDQYDLILYDVTSPKHYERRLMRLIDERAVDGLLVLELSLPERWQKQLKQAGITVVGINGFQQPSWPSVTTDNLRGGYLATRYLIDLGHRAIAYIGETFPDEFGFPSSRLRYDGYVKALTEAGISVQPEYVRLGNFGEDNAHTHTDQLLQLDNPPTAIFAMSDIQAGGCLNSIRERGLRVPEDISVIGFDDIEMSRLMGLTTVRQHLQAMGQLGIRFLLERLSGKTTSAPVVPALEIVERHTTGELEI